VEITPRHFSSRISPCFRHLRARCARPSVPAHPTPRAIEPLHTVDRPVQQLRATGGRTSQLQQQLGAQQGWGGCSKPWPMEAGPGVSPSSPYLRTTRPSGRVSCGVSVQRIGGRQSSQPRGRQRTGSTGLTEQTDRGRGKGEGGAAARLWRRQPPDVTQHARHPHRSPPVRPHPRANQRWPRLASTAAASSGKMSLQPPK
jgi:hypothetical protein